MDTCGLQVYIHTPYKHASIRGREFAVGAETKLCMLTLPGLKKSRKLLLIMSVLCWFVPVSV